MGTQYIIIDGKAMEIPIGHYLDLSGYEILFGDEVGRLGYPITGMTFEIIEKLTHLRRTTRRERRSKKIGKRNPRY